MGQGPAPSCLQRFLLATGERGIGWPAVFGPRQLDRREFALYSYIQQRVLLASTEDGQKTLRQEISLRRQFEREERAALANRQENPAAGHVRISDAPTALPIPTQALPMDPERLSEAEQVRWLEAHDLYSPN